MAMFSATEKKVLKEIVRNEIARIGKTRGKVVDLSPVQLAAEERYEDVLQSILKKLE